jgi:hypothetical protein
MVMSQSNICHHAAAAAEMLELAISHEFASVGTSWPEVSDATAELDVPVVGLCRQGWRAWRTLLATPG